MATIIAPPYYGTVLQNGSSGPDVSLIQRWLNGLRSKWPAIRALVVDGKFGSNTTAAVKTFQTIVSITSDGKVGNVTWNNLYTEYAVLYGPSEIYPGTSMKNGNNGATVKSAQIKLQATVPTLVPDGKFGTKTQNATQVYQSIHGLTVDGIIGKNTWASLYSTM
ncbi:MAG: peptidoglycan-binding protein [Oscillospiraceae bacterium]|nr:peptidoglycan-binding protein [Oscillospiraceae bacterium]